MKRSIAPFVAVALLLLTALPALAASPSPAGATPRLGGAWEITGIETPAGSVRVSGKLAIGTELMASVGCNSMSGPVKSFDGKRLSIGDLAMTLIGCPADLARAESILAAVLGVGELTFDGRSLTSTAGRIDLRGDAPGPIATPSTPPDAVPPSAGGIDPDICAKLLGAEWNVSSTPGAIGGSGGSTGSGSASGGSGVASPPRFVSPPIEIAPSPVQGEPTRSPLPIEPVPVPSGPLPSGPLASGDVPVSTVPAAPGTSAVPVPPVPDPVVPPDPAASASPNATALPLPTASPSLVERCRALLAQLRAGGTVSPGPASDSIAGTGGDSSGGTGGYILPPGTPTAAEAAAAATPLPIERVLAVSAAWLVLMLGALLVGRWFGRKRAAAAEGRDEGATAA